MNSCCALQGWNDRAALTGDDVAWETAGNIGDRARPVTVQPGRVLRRPKYFEIDAYIGRELRFGGREQVCRELGLNVTVEVSDGLGPAKNLAWLVVELDDPIARVANVI